MFESLVEKLLNKFLAPYVEGIERNLHLGVWSGNIVLENLKLKPQITEILDLSFKIIHGNIGRINIQIPWSSLGKSPVCVLIKNVHIYIKPRCYKKSEEVIIEELRKAKMHRLQLLEEEISLIKLQKNNEKSSEKSTLIFKLLNKIINNIQIDIQDILIHFEDPDKNFSIGFILKSSSVKNCQNNEDISTQANSNAENKTLNHIIEFKGLCIYSNSDIKSRTKKKSRKKNKKRNKDIAEILEDDKDKDNEKDSSNGKNTNEIKYKNNESSLNNEKLHNINKRETEHMEIFDISSNVKDDNDNNINSNDNNINSNDNIINSNDNNINSNDNNINSNDNIINNNDNNLNSNNKIFDNNDKIFDNNDKKLDSNIKNNDTHDYSKFSSNDSGNQDDYLKTTLNRISSFLKEEENIILHNYNFEYLIKPFDLVLPVEQSSNKKELKAKLEISDKWEGITLTKTQITKIIEIMNEANKSRNQTNKLLLKHAWTVRLDIESLRNETKNEFINLYNKVLGEEYNISNTELSAQELNRLQILYDVVGVRHLAKWRLQCRSTLEKFIEEKNLKKKFLYDSIYKQQSWWSWVTGNKKEIENKVQSILKSEQDIINENELFMIQEAMTNDDNYDVVMPSKYDFQFKLANFCINVYDDCKKRITNNKNENNNNNNINNNSNSNNINNIYITGDNTNGKEDMDGHHIREDKLNFHNIINDELSINSSCETLLTSSINLSSNDSKVDKKSVRYERVNILSINFYQIYSSLSLQSVVDHNDHDNFQWKFIIELQNFIAKHKNKVFMEFRNNKNSFPYNMNTSGSLYKNSIFYSLLYSQTVCAYLEINHLVTEKGNTLSTILRLNPLELYLSPLLIKSILSFTFPLLDIINKSHKNVMKKYKSKNVSLSVEKQKEKEEASSAIIKKKESNSGTRKRNNKNKKSHHEIGNIKKETNNEEILKGEGNDTIKQDDHKNKNNDDNDHNSDNHDECDDINDDDNNNDDEEDDDEDDDDDEEALLQIKKMEQSELLEGLKERGENVYNRAVQHLPDLFEFYIHICGPILHFDNLTNGIVELHLGNLVAKTEHPCTYNKFNLIFEFNETQITCLKIGSGYMKKDEKSKKDINFNENKKYMDKSAKAYKKMDKSNIYLEINEEGLFSNNAIDNAEMDDLKDSYFNSIKEKVLTGEKFYILQPIPVKIYVEYDLKILKTNIILDGIFFQINPDAISIILAVPTSITRYLTGVYSKNKNENEFNKNKKKTSVEKKEGDLMKGDDITRASLSNIDSVTYKRNSITDIIKRNKDNDNMAEMNNKGMKKEEESFLYDIDFLIKNSSFSIKNKKNCEILKYEACGISYKNYLQKKRKIIKMEIEQLWICDPSNKQPIFFTLTKDINSKDIFLFRSLSTYLEEKSHNNNSIEQKENDMESDNHINVGIDDVLEEDHFMMGTNNNNINNNSTNIRKNSFNIGSNAFGSLERFESAKVIDDNVFISGEHKGSIKNGLTDNSIMNNVELINNRGEGGKYMNTNRFSMSGINQFNKYVGMSMDRKNEERKLNVKKENDEDKNVEEEDDDFMDAIEEKQLSISLQILQEHNEKNIEETHINFIISDIELHWKYKTIKQIFKTMKEYKKTLQYGIEKDMTYIKNKLKNEKDLKNYKMFISENALRSVQETLKNVKDSLNILDIESAKHKDDIINNLQVNEMDNDNIKIGAEGIHVMNPYYAKEENLNMITDNKWNFNLRNEKNNEEINMNNDNTINDNNDIKNNDYINEDMINNNSYNILNDNILSKGLDDTLPKLYGQQNSYPKYFFNCFIKSASLAFWKKKKIFSKIQVSNIFYENKIYNNFDQKMFLNIEKGIMSMNNKNIISNNINDYKYDLFISKDKKMFGSSDMDNEDRNMLNGLKIVKKEGNLNDMQNDDEEKKEEYTGDDTFTERRNSRDILNNINVDNLSLEIKKKKKTMHKESKEDLFIGKIKVYNDKRNYNICLLCEISRMYYIFYLKDLRLFLEYLDDGILNVFISKSYKKVVQAAQTKYFLFNFTFMDPIVIIPEDKNMIYNYKGEVKNVSRYFKNETSNNNTKENEDINDIVKGGAKECILSNEKRDTKIEQSNNYNNVNNKNIHNTNIDSDIKSNYDKNSIGTNTYNCNNIPYIESYLQFHLSKLKLKNSYTLKCTEEIRAAQRRQMILKKKKHKGKIEKEKLDKNKYKNESFVKTDIVPNEQVGPMDQKRNSINNDQVKLDFTLYIDILDIESKACENGGSTNIEGEILHKVNLGFCLINAKNGIFIYLNGNDLCLDLTVFQLAFLLDIINENFCYKGYFPMCFICDKDVSLDSMINSEWFKKGNMNFNNFNNRKEMKGKSNDNKKEDKMNNMNSMNNKMKDNYEIGDGVENNSMYDSDRTIDKEEDQSENKMDKSLTKEKKSDSLTNDKPIIKDSKENVAKKTGLKLYVYINFESLKIKTAFDKNTPVAIITFQYISMSFRLVLLDFYYVYFFDLHGNSLYIDDARKNSINYYKRVAYCCIENEKKKLKKENRNLHELYKNLYNKEGYNDTINESSVYEYNNVERDSSQINKENKLYDNKETYLCNNKEVQDEYEEEVQKRNNSSSNNISVSTQFYRKDYKNLLIYMFENNVFLNEKKKRKKQKGIKIKINSFIEDLLLNIELDDAYICFFFLIFIDIYKFLSTGFNLSTLHLYPKPSPYIVSYKNENKKKKIKGHEYVENNESKSIHRKKKVMCSKTEEEKHIKEQISMKCTRSQYKNSTHNNNNNIHNNSNNNSSINCKENTSISIEENVFKRERIHYDEEIIEENVQLINEEGNEKHWVQKKKKIIRRSSVLEQSKYIKGKLKEQKNKIITNINEVLKLDNKPFHVSFKVNNGNFIIFTDVEKVSHPIIMWSNNFVFSFSLFNKCIVFRKIYAIDSKVKRINYVSSSHVHYKYNNIKKRNNKSNNDNNNSINNKDNDSMKNKNNNNHSKNNNNKIFDPKNISNPLHNYHKKKILLCDNLNVMGEAVYESVDTRTEDYKLKSSVVRKDNNSPFITVFELDINIGNFDIRLSNDDVEILLKASSTLFGDVPSSFTNIVVDPVIPPLTFIHKKIKNKFMQNNIYYISTTVNEETEMLCGSDLQITSINLLKKRRKKIIRKKEKKDARNKIEMERNENNKINDEINMNEKKSVLGCHIDEKKIGQDEYNEFSNKDEIYTDSSNMMEYVYYKKVSDVSSSTNTLSYSNTSLSELHGEKKILYKRGMKYDDISDINNNSSSNNNNNNNNNNNQTKSYRDIKINIKLHNVMCTFIDDIRNSIVPILRMIFSMNISINLYTHECSYNISDLNSKLEYFNNCIGEWEPFLEKCNISLDIHNIFPNDEYDEDKEANKSPISIIKINSIKALWFNITPQLINLLFLFVPVFSEKVSNGLRKNGKKEIDHYNDKDNKYVSECIKNDILMDDMNNKLNAKDTSINKDLETSEQLNSLNDFSRCDSGSVELEYKNLSVKSKSIFEDCSSVFNSFPCDTDGKEANDFHLDDFLKKEENRNTYYNRKDNSVIYYVNLTSEYFYAFLMPESKIEEIMKKKKSADTKNVYKSVNEVDDTNMTIKSYKWDEKKKKVEKGSIQRENVTKGNEIKEKVVKVNSIKENLKKEHSLICSDDNSIHSEANEDYISEEDLFKMIPDLYAKIITTNELISLDRLLINEIENNSLIEKKCLYLYLIPIPPTNVVNIVHDMFSNINKRDIVLDLMITKNPKKTIENLLNYNQHKEDIRIRRNSINSIWTDHMMYDDNNKKKHIELYLKKMKMKGEEDGGSKVGTENTHLLEDQKMYLLNKEMWNDYKNVKGIIKGEDKYTNSTISKTDHTSKSNNMDNNIKGNDTINSNHSDKEYEKRQDMSQNNVNGNILNVMVEGNDELMDKEKKVNKSLSLYTKECENDDNNEYVNDDEEISCDSSSDTCEDYESTDDTNSIDERDNLNYEYYFKYNKKKKNDSNSIFSSNKFVGPFLRNTECVIINLIKNSCTSLTTSLKNSNVIHLLKPGDFVFDEKYKYNFSSKKTNEIMTNNSNTDGIMTDDSVINGSINNNNNNMCNKSIQNNTFTKQIVDKYVSKNSISISNNKHNKSSILNKENIDKINEWERRNEEMIKQTYIACKYRLKNNYLPQTSLVENVCEIISPMPNYKILFMSSTVRIINKCGIPLEFCFFDGSRNPILLTSLENRTIPINTLYPNHSDSFKNYKVSNSLNINPNIKLRQKNNNLSFTVILNHEYLLSAPECVFCGPSHVYMSFKPINVITAENEYYDIVTGGPTTNSVNNNNNNNNSISSSHNYYGNKSNVNDLLKKDKRGNNDLIDPMSINIENGWSDIFSSDISQGTYVKKCKYKDMNSFMSNINKSNSSGNNYFYFLVKIENKISALPAEKNLKIITIYPHVSVVNAIPAFVDIIITSDVVEDKQNDYMYEERNKIDALKNKRARLLKQCEDINSYLSKVNASKYGGSKIYSDSSSKVTGKKDNSNSSNSNSNNSEHVYMQELNKLEREIYHIDEEIKYKKKELSSPLVKGYVNRRLNPFSIFYIYEIKKYTCLNLKMKIGNSQCEWSEKLFLVEDDEESVTRFSLHFKKYASVEVEIIKNFSGYFNSLSSILGNKQLYIFSLPRCFIDRTGLGIKAINSNKYYPVINGITLLGEHSQIDLLLPHKTYTHPNNNGNSGNNSVEDDRYNYYYKGDLKRSNRMYDKGGNHRKDYNDGNESYGNDNDVNKNDSRYVNKNAIIIDYNDIFNDFNYPSPANNSVILFKATLPPIGSYTETNVICKNFFYTFCLNTEKIKTTNIPYIISRIITVVPQFIISNKLNYPLLIKQYQNDQIQGVRANDTSPLYFTKKSSILLFQFKCLDPSRNSNEDKNNMLLGPKNVIKSNGNKYYKLNKNIYWSSVIYPSENFVGTNYMVINTGNHEKSDVYAITCIPDRGTKNIIIEKLESKKKGFIAYNNSSIAKYLKIRTFHDDTRHMKLQDDENYIEKNMFLSNFLKPTDMEHYFNIEPNKYSYLGWVNPFIYVTRNVQIEIVLEDLKIIPKSPFVLKFAIYNYSQKTYYINYYNFTFIICIEYIEDLITIKLSHKFNISSNVLDHSPYYYMMNNKSNITNGIAYANNSHNNIRSIKHMNSCDNSVTSNNDVKIGINKKKKYMEMENQVSIEKYNIINGKDISNEGNNIDKNSENSLSLSKNSAYAHKQMMIDHDEYHYVKHIDEKDGGTGSYKNNSICSSTNNYYKNESVKVISNTYKNVHIIINVTQIGVSIISNILKEEVFFIELSKLCALFYMKNEEEVIDIKITDVQIDCQLESCEKCVLLANRGISSSNNNNSSSNNMITGGDISGSNSVYQNYRDENKSFTSNENDILRFKKTFDRNSDDKINYMNPLYENNNNNNKSRGSTTNSVSNNNNYNNNSNSVLNKNMSGNEEKIFLNIYVERSFISHNDVIFKKIQVSLDDVEIEMDAETLNGINLLTAEYIESLSIVQKKNLLYEEIQKWTILPVYVNYKSPEIPLAINIQYMQIDKFTLIVWCSFLLDKMHMMSDLLRIGLRILMVSGKLELLGAPVTLNQEIFNNIRVSIKSFYALLKDKYSHSILACLGFIVGYSSLINIPKIPLEIGRNTIGLAVYAVDNVSVGIGSFLSNLTFDSEYINRRQKERTFKTNTNMKEGLISAVKNIGEGVLSLSNIVTKPIEGAQKEGFGGFFKGIGKGVAGSLVKPLDKVGQAVSDVTRGIKAEVSKPIGGHKYKTKRHRKPRMLWGEYGKLKEYNINEAELRECLGLKFSKNIMKCLTVHKQENYPPSHYALLLYPKVIIYANLYANTNAQKNDFLLSEKKTDIVIWSIKIEDITEIRASSHGLIVRTNTSTNTVYKIPCNNAILINKIYRELHNSKNSINSTVILGANNSALYKYL
ncbi:conserved Plasmodium protein, unknown function [Plasmodium sp. gorilla clade G2]|uniref:conserved Plasmodium protein, unknown function n=1 Tax=Plasmodium sp. gorilla clade G2 TaxID=880535 RepID=UPI000D213806|nr:conserved Plasmodium protein, unknown function [Plasmodium sp. gorilla clade G2]SOV18191.1 conserved Plasmodium protein, unknown function [Plasmodium sp. gorilla clade G2]